MSHQVIYFEQMTQSSKPKVPSRLRDGLTLTETGLEDTPPRYDDQNTYQQTKQQQTKQQLSNIKRSHPNTRQPTKRQKSQ